MKQYILKTEGAKLRLTDTQVKWKYSHLVSDLAKGIVFIIHWEKATDLYKHMTEMVGKYP